MTQTTLAARSAAAEEPSGRLSGIISSWSASESPHDPHVKLAYQGPPRPAAMHAAVHKGEPIAHGGASGRIACGAHIHANQYGTKSEHNSRREAQREME